MLLLKQFQKYFGTKQEDKYTDIVGNFCHHGGGYEMGKMGKEPAVVGLDWSYWDGVPVFFLVFSGSARKQTGSHWYPTGHKDSERPDFSF